MYIFSFLFLVFPHSFLSLLAVHMVRLKGFLQQQFFLWFDPYSLYCFNAPELSDFPIFWDIFQLLITEMWLFQWCHYHVFRFFLSRWSVLPLVELIWFCVKTFLLISFISTNGLWHYNNWIAISSSSFSINFMLWLLLLLTLWFAGIKCLSL